MADPKLEALIRMKIMKNAQPTEPPIFDDTQPQPEAPPDQGMLSQMLKNKADFSQFSDAPTQGMTQPQSVDAMHANNKAKFQALRETPVNGAMASPTAVANAVPRDPRVSPDPNQFATPQIMQAMQNPVGDPRSRELLRQALIQQAQKAGQAIQGGAASAQAALQQKYNPGGFGSVPTTPMPPRR
ncbi:MAG: hypothetical protein E6Q97_15505 [Desulfurellales bacterium]|nr:MAG: hypothetical protein E6Q97_15505 [Desulfurellales bacterium]